MILDTWMDMLLDRVPSMSFPCIVLCALVTVACKRPRALVAKLRGAQPTTRAPASPSAIAELREVDLADATRLAVLIRGEPRAPLLLVLHGGPGASEIAGLSDWASRLEKHLLVATYDQRAKP